MEELVDMLTEDGKYIGKLVSKKESHQKGLCHGLIAVALIDDNGMLLIQKRAKNKKIEPNKWDLSAAGHIDAGESPEEAAVRETYEEIGIKIDKSKLKKIDTYLCKIKLDENTFINHFTYLYVVNQKFNVDEIKRQETEVDEIALVNKSEYQALFSKKQMVEGAKYCSKILEHMK